jgi:hypothetical protein
VDALQVEKGELPAEEASRIGALVVVRPRPRDGGPDDPAVVERQRGQAVDRDEVRRRRAERVGGPEVDVGDADHASAFVAVEGVKCAQLHGLVPGDARLVAQGPQRGVAECLLHAHERPGQ